MKLIYCLACEDIVRLTSRTRKCRCKLSWGRYLDGMHATVGGKAIPLGIDNLSFHYAVVRQPLDGIGVLFTAFVIPKHCDHITSDVTIKELA